MTALVMPTTAGARLLHPRVQAASDTGTRFVAACNVLVSEGGLGSGPRSSSRGRPSIVDLGSLTGPERKFQRRRHTSAMTHTAPFAVTGSRDNSLSQPLPAMEITGAGGLRSERRQCISYFVDAGPDVGRRGSGLAAVRVAGEGGQRPDASTSPNHRPHADRRRPRRAAHGRHWSPGTRSTGASRRAQPAACPRSVPTPTAGRARRSRRTWCTAESPHEGPGAPQPMPCPDRLHPDLTFGGVRTNRTGPARHGLTSMGRPQAGRSAGRMSPSSLTGPR
jgi:hypothetical protein